MDLGEEGKLRFSDRGAVLPMTFGHEIAGSVEAIGSDVNRPAGFGVPLGRLRRMPRL